MQIEYAVICDFAEIVAGKLYLMGGGWDNYWGNDVPVAVRLAVSVGVRVAWEETNQAIPVRVFVEDDDGHQLVAIEGVVNVGRPPGLPPGSGQLAQMAANIPFSAPKFGGYRVRIDAGEPADTQVTLPFRVLKRQATT